MRALGPVTLAVVCFALGAVAEHVYDHQVGEGGRSASVAEAPRIHQIDYASEPLWAYGFETVRQDREEAAPQSPPSRRLRPNEDPAEQTRPRTVPDSTATYSLVDVRDSANVIDWFPRDHPSPMPDIIAHGPAALGDRKWACGSCHLPNGMGRPENAPPGGQPIAYVMRQLQDFRNGLRRSADPRKPNTNTMIALARGMTEQEMREAAEYFSQIPYPARTRIVETPLVPKTRIVNNLFIATAAEKTEPIAGRIIEVPEDEEQTERVRNPRVGFVAYVPPGSLEAGKDLVTTGGMRVVDNAIVQGRTTGCVTCHGLDLMGVTEVPAIAGRSPSYVVRQMWDIQQGTRGGEGVQLMKLAIARLTPDDLRAVAAYVASRPARRTEPVTEVATK
jgi:cytochrome c553